MASVNVTSFVQERQIGNVGGRKRKHVESFLEEKGLTSLTNKVIFKARAFSDLFGKFLVPMKLGKNCVILGKNMTILGKIVQFLSKFGKFTF